MAETYKLKMDDETRQKIVEFASTNFNRYVSQREEIDDVVEDADFMYTCAANRTMASSTKSIGMNLEKDNRAQVGSTIFYRQVNTLAGLLYSVLRSRDDLFRYSTGGKDTTDGEQRARSATFLARWTRKKDNVDARLPEFCVRIFKEANTFMQVYWKRTFKTVSVMTPEYETSEDSEGNPITVVSGEKVEEIKIPADNYPCIRFLPHDMVFADRFIPSIRQQNLVVVLSLRNKSEIYSDVLSGYFDEDAYERLDQSKQWGGTYAFDMKEKQAVNRNQTFSPSGTGLFLQWDCYLRVPVEKNKWDEKFPDRLYWGTWVGNTLNDAELMRFDKNSDHDPDDEIPIQDIHASPDREDQLYHTTLAEIVRSSYSADCTLLGMALDNMGAVNDPPLLIRDGFHRVKDFTFRKGARWHVNDMNAIKQFEIRDATQQTAVLRQQVQDDIKSALATDANVMGEYAGARTSATEVMSATQNTRQPHLMQIGYIINQMIPFIARKWMSYWQRFGLPMQVIQITDENKTYEIKPTEISGEFDVEVDILDEFEENAMRTQQAQNLLQIIGSVPALQNSPQHSIDMGYIMRELIESMRWLADKIVRPPSGVDAEIVAENENASLLSGAYVRPRAGEDSQTHLRVHQGERVRWRGLEQTDDARARNIQLLDQHILETQQLMEPNAGSPQAPMGNQTEGEIMGNAQAAAIGSAQPQVTA